MTKARITAQDLWRMGEADVRRELINGEVIQMPPHSGFHGWITGRIHRPLAEHVRRHGGGQVLVGDVGFILRLPYDPERIRGPDVAFISDERSRELPHEGFLEGAPDLVIEVLSPSDTSGEVDQKVRDYLEAGARLLWFFAPHAKTVRVYRPDGSARLLRDHETLDGEDVLPGFEIALSEIF